MGAIANQFTEISTPFMNLRQLMFYHKLNESKCAKVNNLIFAAVFTVFRLMFQMTFLLYCLPWLISELLNKVH